LGWGLLGASRARAGGLGGSHGAEGSKSQFVFPLLDLSWGPLGPSWGPPGPSWGPLGPCWAPLGGTLRCLGAIVCASWALLDAVKTKKANVLNIYVSLKSAGRSLFLGALFWGSSLGAFWRPHGPSSGHIGRLGKLLGRLGGLLDHLGGSLGPSWPVLGHF